MQIETTPIDSIHPDPANARRHPKRNLDAIMASLVRFGQQKPIVVDGNGIVRAGNGTLAAAKALGWTEVRVVRSALLGTEATAFAIADNRTAELAEWDDDVLARTLADPELGDVGFTAREVEKLTTPLAQTIAEPTEVGTAFQLVVECKDEPEQRALFDRLTAEGHPCRVLTL